jgi:hypothetical protein
MEARRVKQDALRMAQLAASRQRALIDAGRQHLSGLSQFREAARGQDLPRYDRFFATMLRMYPE